MFESKEEIKRMKQFQKDVLILTENIDTKVTHKDLNKWVEDSTIGEIKENMWEMYQIIAEITRLCEESIR
jgi:hypothetical protein